MKKSMIPNLLTLIRICLVPIMIILSLLKLYIPVIVLAIIGSLTDMLDGKLARKWHVTSLKGEKLDALADKIFGIGLMLCLLPKQFNNIIIILILEIISMLLNYYYHRKAHRTETLMIGKFKMTFLFITIISCFLCIVNNKFKVITSGLKFATINLQILAIISYYIKYYKVTHKIIIDDQQDKKKMLNENDTIIVNSIQDLDQFIKKDD